MAAKINWHRYGTKLRDRHPVTYVCRYVKQVKAQLAQPPATDHEPHCRHVPINDILEGSVREYVFFVFFQISKNMTFYVFLK